MSDKQKKIALGVAIVLVIAFVGDAMGFWEMTSWIPSGGPEGGQ